MAYASTLPARLRAVRPAARLLRDFVRRDVRGRYFGTVSGAAWSLLNPAAQLCVYGFVFGTVFDLRFPQAYGTNVVTFIALAIWPWTMFLEALQRAMGSIPANADLIRKIAFPRVVLPLSGVVSSFVVHGIGYFFVLCVLAALGNPVKLLGLPLVLLMLFVLFLLSVSIGLVLAAAQAIVRDVEHGSGPVFMLLLYATPVLYPVDLVPVSIRWVLMLNPLTFVMTRIRDGWLGAALPNGGDLAALALALMVAAIAYGIFKRISVHFEEFA